MFIFLILFLLFYCFYYYLSYQVILLNDLNQIFSQTASKAQEDLKEYSELVLEDLGKCYPHVIVIIGSAAIVCFIWILLLKYNAKLIIWLSIFSMPILLIGGLYYSLTTYLRLRKRNNPDDDPGDDLSPSGYADDFLPSDQNLAFDKAIQTILTAELMSYVHNETVWLTLSIVLSVILIALFIILHSLRDRVKLSIALIKQASKAINGVKSTLLFPIIHRTIGVGVLVFGVLVSLLIISASHPTYQIVGGRNHGLPCHPRLFNKTHAPIPQRPKFDSSFDNRLQHPNPGGRVQFNEPLITSNTLSPPILELDKVPIPQPVVSTFKDQQTLANGRPQCVASQPLKREHVWKYHALNIFATLWMIHFMSGISQATLAGAFASYYWAYKKPEDIPFFAVSKSFFRVIFHHLGDIAFGSFLIATIRYIRLVIEFIDNRIRNKGSTDATNQATRSAACFFRVFFWIIDRFLRYIDRNAYIMMSMYGEGYLQSAKRAVELLYKNSTRALVLDYVTYFVLLVSRLLITGFAGYMTAQDTITANLHYKWLPVALVVLGTYFISKGLFSVYSMAVDTLFVCFLIDSTNNDGSSEKPYFMSKELRRIVKRNTVIP